MRVATMSSPTEECALRNARALSRFLMLRRRDVRLGVAARSDMSKWRDLVAEFTELLTMSTLAALSPEYQRGSRIAQIIEETLDAFGAELSQDRDPIAALARLSAENAIRILTIHKCKGLEFEKVIVLGVEHELFWSPRPEDNRAEFFVAISRAKSELILTATMARRKPSGVKARWYVDRHAQQEFLNYAID